MVNVYCVKWGTKYDRSFVENLKTSIEKHFTIEHKFNCLTDKPEKEYDQPVQYPYLKGVWHKLSLFEKVGKNLFFDLDVEINGDIDFLVWNHEDFKKLHVINSTNWVSNSMGQSEMKFATRNNTFINSSVMRWEDSYSIFEKFMEKRDLYLRLYEGIDRFIYNERERLGLKYKTFTTNKISSWQEDVTKNTIMIYNGKYNDIRPENN